jgi:CRP-like cAMP-binding protein
MNSSSLFVNLSSDSATKPTFPSPLSRILLYSPSNHLERTSKVNAIYDSESSSIHSGYEPSQPVVHKLFQTEINSYVHPSVTKTLLSMLQKQYLEASNENCNSGKLNVSKGSRLNFSTNSHNSIHRLIDGLLAKDGYTSVNLPAHMRSAISREMYYSVMTERVKYLLLCRNIFIKPSEKTKALSRHEELHHNNLIVNPLIHKHRKLSHEHHSLSNTQQLLQTMLAPQRTRPDSATSNATRFSDHSSTEEDSSADQVNSAHNIPSSALLSLASSDEIELFNKLAFLAHVPLFIHLPFHNLLQLSRHLQQISLEKYEILSAEGEAATHCYLVIQGRLDVKINIRNTKTHKQLQEMNEQFIGLNTSPQITASGRLIRSRFHEAHRPCLDVALLCSADLAGEDFYTSKSYYCNLVSMASNTQVYAIPSQDFLNSLDPVTLSAFKAFCGYNTRIRLRHGLVRNRNLRIHTLPNSFDAFLDHKLNRKLSAYSKGSESHRITFKSAKDVEEEQKNHENLAAYAQQDQIQDKAIQYALRQNSHHNSQNSSRQPAGKLPKLSKAQSTPALSSKSIISPLAQKTSAEKGSRLQQFDKLLSESSQKEK